MGSSSLWGKGIRAVFFHVCVFVCLCFGKHGWWMADGREGTAIVFDIFLGYVDSTQALRVRCPMLGLCSYGAVDRFSFVLHYTYFDVSSRLGFHFRPFIPFTLLYQEETLEILNRPIHLVGCLLVNSTAKASNHLVTIKLPIAQGLFHGKMQSVVVFPTNDSIGSDYLPAVHGELP